MFSHYSSFIPLVLVLFVWGTFVTLCVTVTNIFLLVYMKNKNCIHVLGFFNQSYDFSRKSLSKYLMDTIDFNKHDIDIFINLAKIANEEEWIVTNIFLWFFENSSDELGTGNTRHLRKSIVNDESDEC